MNAYTISKLAEDAGVSVDIVRNYEQRGLIAPCCCTQSGYRLYDRNVLDRLRFVLAGKEAGIPLEDLATLCKALDNGALGAVRQSLARVHELTVRRNQAISRFHRWLKRVDQLENKNRRTVDART